ncbi:MAG: T9SS type A sorting domain-containing protein [Bacteroidota bacterium]
MIQYSLTILAKADVNLSEAIGISSRLTEAEAYTDATGQHEDLAVALVIGNTTQESENALYQNRPNPFRAETVIGFKLAEASEGILEIKDIRGRTILIKDGDFTRGYNEVRLGADELPTGGVYFYTLNAGAFQASKKMILTK